MMQLVSNPKVTRFIPGTIQDREMLVSWVQSLGPEDYEDDKMGEGQNIILFRKEI